MSSRGSGSNIPWWVIVLGFIFCWPIGIILLFLSLGGVRIPVGKEKQDFSAPSSAGQARYQTPPAYDQAPPEGKKAFQKLSNGFLTVLGGLFSFGSLVSLVDEWSTFGLHYVSDWFPVFGLFCAGLVMLYTGLSGTRRGRRYRLYLGVIGQRKSVFLSDLAGAAGVSEKKVVRDLQRMLSDGILPMGYIDRASGRLVLTDQGYEAPPQPEVKEEPQEAVKADEDYDNNILRQIREVNDAIPDEVMTAKIDRIGEITGKILDYQRRNPSKAPELRQFLNYYLPTTLKILNAYAQMDAQGIEGENISAAKHRIEGMMDKVVEGFEKQLDQLFKSDAMDITSDVEVLERMLDKDGLGGGMTLGG
jgi:hypothetical protein